MAKRQAAVAVAEVNGETGIQFSQTLVLTRKGVENILTRWAVNRKMAVGPDGVRLTIDVPDDQPIATIEAGYKPMTIRTRNRGDGE